MDNRNIIDICTNYAWLVPLKDKKVITIANAFQKILDESNRKRNKLWVHKWCGFILQKLNEIMVVG